MTEYCRCNDQPTPGVDKTNQHYHTDDTYCQCDTLESDHDTYCQCDTFKRDHGTTYCQCDTFVRDSDSVCSCDDDKEADAGFFWGPRKKKLPAESNDYDALSGPLRMKGVPKLDSDSDSESESDVYGYDEDEDDDVKPGFFWRRRGVTDAKESEFCQCDNGAPKTEKKSMLRRRVEDIKQRLFKLRQMKGVHHSSEHEEENDGEESDSSEDSDGEKSESSEDSDGEESVDDLHPPIPPAHINGAPMTVVHNPEPKQTTVAGLFANLAK